MTEKKAFTLSCVCLAIATIVLFGVPSPYNAVCTLVIGMVMGIIWSMYVFS